MAENFYKKRGIFDEDRSGFAFREVFTPTREGPLPPRPHLPRSGKGGPSINQPYQQTGSVWSAADAAANGVTLSNGGSSIVYHGSSSWVSARGTVSKSSGKVYVEFKYGGGAGAQNFAMVGLASSGFDPTSYVGTSNYSGGYALPNFAYVSTGFASVDTPNLNVAAIGDVIGIAVDFTAQKIWYSYNNVWNIVLERPGPRDPAAGTFNNMTFVAATVGALFPTISLHGDGVNGGGTWILQPSAASQTYAPPAGFSAWDGGVAPPPTSVWSAADAAANGMTLSNGGLTAHSTASAWSTVRGSISKTSGKLYVEFLANLAQGAVGYDGHGFASSSFIATNYLGSSQYSVGITNGGSNPVSPASGAFTSNYTTTTTPITNDVWALAIDFTAGSIWIARNNVWLNSSNPATGSLPIVSFVAATVGALFPGVSMWGVNETWTLQATAASQKYAPPSGFTPWG